MGIRFNCPNGHKLNVKEFLAGKRGVCPQCGAKFVIPMPAEAAVTESPQPVGIGLSQSVEIAVSPTASHQVASASPSPSIIIPVTEIELVPLEPVLQPAVRPPEIPIAAGLPESILAGSPPIVVVPVGVAPEAVLPSPRERSRRNQMVISLLLLALVVLLAGVLIWVLKREVNQTPVEKKSAAAHGEFHQVFAMASSGLLMSAHPRVGALQQ
jgi:hypothetical protein